MAKRFTDSAKWRNEWFRTLPLKAKLTWIYFCDECEFHGVIKLDYGLASFQLGFDVTKQLLVQWFGYKIHFITDENILIPQFFEFQYGESKDNWSAKIKAKEKLQSLGFIIENNKITNLPTEGLTTVVPLSPDGGNTVLIKGKGKGIGILKGGVGENFSHELFDLWNQHCAPLPKAIKLNKERFSACVELWRVNQDPEFWISVIKRMSASSFCRGETESWKKGSDFDHFLKPKTYINALEGKYDNKFQPTTSPKPNPFGFNPNL